MPDGLASSPELARALRRFRLRPGTSVVPLAGDVGQRRYFRVPGGNASASVVLVVYPEAHSPAQASWTSLGAAIRSAGLRVPELHEDAPEVGAALIEDLGSRDLSADLAEAGAERRAALLSEAEDLLPALRSLPAGAATLNPAFDASFFRGELDHTRTWALERGGATPLPEGDRAEWEALAAGLARAAADPAETGAPVPTHRDFHANNLMRTADGTLALIDFQDLRMGPPDYDPVSLRFERAGSLVPSDPGRFSEAVLLQRAWKVLGTFEKMLLRGREIYRPHREAAIATILRATRPGGRFGGLLRFLPAGPGL